LRGLARNLMKETKKSLKWYLIAIGILSLWGISNIGIINKDFISGILLLINAFFGVLFLYTGMKIDELLDKSPKFIFNILITWLGFIIINSLYNFVKGLFVGANIISVIISVLITIYLIKNLKRLSNETKI